MRIRRVELRLVALLGTAGARPLIALLVLTACLLSGEPAGAVEVRSIEGAAKLMDLWVDQQMEYRGIPGLAVAVISEGEVVWSQGYGWADLDGRVKMTPATPFRVGSVSKLFTSTAALVVRDDGALRLADPVSRFVPSFPSFSGEGPDAEPAGESADDVGDSDREASAREATVRDLLLHTSGLPREAPFPYWTDHVFPDRDELLSALAEIELRSVPGAEYLYSNLGMGLLGEVVSAASDTSFAEFLATRVFAPLGMNRSTVNPTPQEIESLAVGYMRRRSDGSRGVFEYYDTGALAGAANVVSTIEDLARFASFHLGHGRDRVLSPASRREMQRPVFLRSWQSARGLGFSVSPLGDETAVSHGGWIAGHRTHFLLVPEKDVAVVAVVNSDDGEPYRFARAAYDTFAQVLGSRDDTLAETDRDWSLYLGLLADPWEWEYRVIELDGGLVLYDYNYPPADAPGDGATWLEPQSSDPADRNHFQMPGGDPVVFFFDPEGRIERVQRRDNFLFPIPRDVMRRSDSTHRHNY